MGMSEEKLLIITRFVYKELGDVPRYSVLTKQRLDILQSNFINSLKAQTNKNFSIIMYLASWDNPTAIATQNLDWNGLNVEFVYTDESLLRDGQRPNESEEDSPAGLIRRFPHQMSPLMARLDSDDIVGPGWVSHIFHMYNSYPGNFLINYLHYIQKQDGRLFYDAKLNGCNRATAFLALIQRNGEKVSPYMLNHMKMLNVFEKVYTVPPGYVFVSIHDSNNTSRFRPSRQLSLESLRTNYEVIKDVEH